MHTLTHDVRCHDGKAATGPAAELSLPTLFVDTGCRRCRPGRTRPAAGCRLTVVCRHPFPSRVSGIFRTSGVHLTGRGWRGAPELPLVKALGVADRTPGGLNGPKQA